VKLSSATNLGPEDKQVLYATRRVVEALFWLVVGLAALAVVVPPMLWRRFGPGRLSTLLATLVAFLAVLWLVNLGLIASDYRDADGWVDCYPSCSGLQRVVGGVAIWGGALLIVCAAAAVAGLVACALARRRQPSA
jgi:hypothetical protein